MKICFCDCFTGGNGNSRYWGVQRRPSCRLLQEIVPSLKVFDYERMRNATCCDNVRLIDSLLDQTTTITTAELEFSIVSL